MQDVMTMMTDFSRLKGGGGGGDWGGEMGGRDSEAA